MTGGVLPLLLLYATVGLLLSRFDGVKAWSVVAVVVATGQILSFAPVGQEASAIVVAGLWISIIICAGLVLLPNAEWQARWVLPAALNAGAWAGLFASLGDNWAGLLGATPLLLLFLPDRWMTQKGFTVGLKVAASWMIAIASLSLFVSQLPTPGYEADHMQ